LCHKGHPWRVLLSGKPGAVQSEKLEIIRTVEGSHLPVKQTLDMLGIPRTTFYRWYDRYVDGGFDALADRSPRPGSVWNRIPDARRDDLIEFALEHEALTTRELAVKYTDEKQYFISESSAYRMLKAADLITAPDYVVIKAAPSRQIALQSPAGQWTSSPTKPRPSTKCPSRDHAAHNPAGQRDRLTSPTSRSLAGAGII
tara:strand:- start:417 stop:1016 length:600 start_codon:yes stop_codon:yes gene_type:complete